MADNDNIWDRYDAMVLGREAMQRKIEELSSICDSLRARIGDVEQALRYEREDCNNLRKDLNAACASRESWHDDYVREADKRERFEHVAYNLIHCILCGGMPSAEAVEELSKYCATIENPIEKVKRIREVTGASLQEATAIVKAKREGHRL